MAPTKTITAEPRIIQIIADMQFDQTPAGLVGKLTCGQLDRPTYTAVNKVLDTLQGKWKKNLGGHVFDRDPRPQLAELMGNGAMKVIKDGYFPTPAAIVERMIAAANLERWHVVLEPSAGNGHIADLVRPLVERVDVIELDNERCNNLERKGYNIVGDNFIDFSGTYERILMNPPFEQGQDIEHVEHAYQCLESQGVLVAIMAESVMFSKSSRAVAFREDYLEPFGYADKLPDGSFKDSGTGVNTRLVRLHRP